MVRTKVRQCLRCKQLGDYLIFASLCSNLCSDCCDEWEDSETCKLTGYLIGLDSPELHLKMFQMWCDGELE
jgi:hypothetical protein